MKFRYQRMPQLPWLPQLSPEKYEEGKKEAKGQEISGPSEQIYPGCSKYALDVAIEQHGEMNASFRIKNKIRYFSVSCKNSLLMFYKGICSALPETTTLTTSCPHPTSENIQNAGAGRAGAKCRRRRRAGVRTQCFAYNLVLPTRSRC